MIDKDPPLLELDRILSSELRRLNLDTRCMTSAPILSTLLIKQLVAYMEAKQAEIMVGKNDEEPDAVSTGELYLVFAKNRTEGIKWAVRTGNPRWTWVQSMGTIRGLIGREKLRGNSISEPLGNRYQVVVLGDLTEYPEMNEALSYVLMLKETLPG